MSGANVNSVGTEFDSVLGGSINDEGCMSNGETADAHANATYSRTDKAMFSDDAAEKLQY